MLTQLSKDELFLIAMKLDYPSLLKFSMCNKRIYDKIYANENVWNGKLKEFPDYLNPKYDEKIYDINVPNVWRKRESPGLIPDYRNKNKREIYILLYRLTILKEVLKTKNNIYDFYNVQYFEFGWLRDDNVPIEEIFKHIEILINLKVLQFSDNDLTYIPKMIGKLVNLEKLYLDNNKITEIPKELKNLANLQYFYINNNLLEEIPDGFEHLKQFDMRGNPIKLNVSRNLL